MCRRGIIGCASVWAMIQAFVWMCFGLIGSFVYLCIIPVPPFRTPTDFFRVTLVKLYFEGPWCEPDGTYLGTFKNYYKHATIIRPNYMFGLSTAYFSLNFGYLILSVMLFRARNGFVDRVLALFWSGTTFLLSLLDFFVTFSFVLDISFLPGRHHSDFVNLYKMPLIPFMLALISSRLVFGWLWNVFVGSYIFIDALCCMKIVRRPPKEEVKIPGKEEPFQPGEVPQPAVNILNGNYRSQFDITAHPDYMDYKKSMEAVTRFNTPERPMSVQEQPQRRWNYAPSEASRYPKSHSSRDWEMTNEAFVGDEPPEALVDFDHDLKNFESGQKRIKVVKPPLGKPVGPHGGRRPPSV